VESVAVILLLLLAIAILTNFAQGGWPQVRTWLKAKFVGH